MGDFILGVWCGGVLFVIRDIEKRLPPTDNDLPLAYCLRCGLLVSLWPVHYIARIFVWATDTRKTPAPTAREGGEDG